MTILGFWLRTVALTTVFLAVSAAFVPIALFTWRQRSAARWYGRTLSLAARFLLGVRTRVEGGERLATGRPCVYVANHRTNLDMFFCGAVFPSRTVLIGKREIAWVPVFGLLFVALRNILIDRGNHAKAVAGLDEAVEALRTRGESIWIFPEGTRNRSGKLLGEFKKGAFHMAVAAQVPIQPLVFGRTTPHYDFAARRIRPGTVRMLALPPIPTIGLGPADVPALLERTREAMVRALTALESEGPNFGAEAPGSVLAAEPT